jgi:hypothetical protein
MQGVNDKLRVKYDEKTVPGSFTDAEAPLTLCCPCFTDMLFL